MMSAFRCRRPPCCLLKYLLRPSENQLYRLVPALSSVKLSKCCPDVVQALFRYVSTNVLGVSKHCPVP